MFCEDRDEAAVAEGAALIHTRNRNIRLAIAIEVPANREGVSVLMEGSSLAVVLKIAKRENARLLDARECFEEVGGVVSLRGDVAPRGDRKQKTDRKRSLLHRGVASHGAENTERGL